MREDASGVSGTSVLDGARERGFFAGEGGRTDATFERAILADGTPVVIKHVTPNDWLVRATEDSERLFRMWRDGIFARVPEPIDHAMVAVERYEEGVILVMRDLSQAFLGDDRVLSREENRRVIAAVDGLHKEFWGEHIEGLLSLYDHYSLLTPKRMVPFEDVPILKLMLRGWDLFEEVAPSDVTFAMRTLLEDPEPFVRELGARPQTLIHGDLRLHNMGLTDDRVVLFDWEISGMAPPAVEFAWYLIISASRIEATREQVLDDYREISGERFDPHALELALIGALMWLGWNKALDIVENPDPAIRAQERADLDWWIARVREALQTWSPV